MQPEGTVTCISTLKGNHKQCSVQPQSRFWRLALNVFFSHFFQEDFAIRAYPKTRKPQQSQMLLA